MSYNMDFLIAALVFLLILLLHFLEQQRMDVGNNRTFFAFLLIGIADIVFDILTTLLMSLKDPRLVWLTRGCLLIFYLLQVLVPYALQSHLLTQYADKSVYARRIAWTALPALMFLFVLANLWTGLLYRVEDTGAYVQGPLYLSMYVYAIVYVVASIAFACLHRAEIGAKKFGALWEVYIFAGGCVVIQGLFNTLLTTGFGIALGITVLFFTMNNPYLNTDNLTGAFEGRYFLKRVRGLKQSGRAFHLIAVELNQMKRVSLVYGADAGDQLVFDTAETLRAINRRNLIFRIADERFLVMTFDIRDYEDALERIQEIFASPEQAETDAARRSALICAIDHAERFGSGESLLEYVSYLMRLIRPGTESRLIQNNEETRKGFRYEQAIEHYLPIALENNLFDVYYQPIYSVREGKYVPIEVLSRLQHPTLGPVSPEVFIRLAEKNDLIASFDVLQLRGACRFLKEHAELISEIRNVKFNLSPTELIKSGHARELIDIIREYGLPTELFQFEITETMATEYGKSLNEAVRLFARAGVGLCLDDFGAGFANLNTVLRLPFSTIKLDRSLLKGICEDAKVTAFYQNIAAMLRNMGYAVVAEGVENRREMELVSGWGVDLVQGFYFSPPLSGDALEKEICARKNAS